MAQYRITGKHALSGTIRVSGRKNAALKLLAATVLTTGTTTLEHVPDISDVRAMLDILRALGAEVEHVDKTVTISTANLTSQEIPYKLGRKLRASIVLVGPLLARFGKVSFPHPGGCVIGKRSIEPHLEGLRLLGADIDFDGTTYHLTGKKLAGTLIYLKEKSVTGTENIMMAAIGASGTTTVVNCAEEQHISNLADLLRMYGYNVSGDGSSMMQIEGNAPKLSNADATITIIPDEIEIGTFAVAALITGGSIKLERVGGEIGLLPLLSKLDDFNANYEYDEAQETLTILPSPDLVASDVQTNPWPGFFPDLESPFAVLASQANGQSLIHDWMYEGRLNFVENLERMGADVTICDVHRVIVNGPTPLVGARSITPDIRAGAALVLAALAAEGESIIQNIELIERGYASLPERLQSLGANIIREED